MPEVLLRRIPGLLFSPADGVAARDAERFPMGRDLLCTLKQPRSLAHNRLYWACLHRVADNLDQALTAQALHEWLKLRLGFASPVALRSGKVEWVPNSTAFDRLDQQGFNEYSERAFAMIKVGFGIDPDDVKREGAELLGTDSLPEVDTKAEGKRAAATGAKGTPPVGFRRA